MRSVTIKIVLLLLVLTGCGNGQDSPAGSTPLSLFAVARSRHPENTGKEYIFTANPGDCINCLNLLHIRLKEAGMNKAGNVIIVLRNHRMVEREDLLQSTLAGIDSSLIPLIWDDSLYRAVNREAEPQYREQSLLLIYDKHGNKIFCKPVKEITGTEKEVLEIFQ